MKCNKQGELQQADWNEVNVKNDCESLNNKT